MTVTLKCDLCEAEITLEPGEHTEQHYGWKWIVPASFNHSYRILPETLCDKCKQSIDIAKHNAEIAARSLLKR